MQDFCYNNKKLFREDFLHEKHVNYLLYSLKKSSSGTPLDVSEAHRLSSLFFVVSGLDLLGALDTRLIQSDKTDIIEWIYSYQVDINKVKIPDHLNDYTSEKFVLFDNGFKNNDSNSTTPIKRPLSSPVINDDGVNNGIDDYEKRVGHSGFRSTSMIDSDIPLDCGIISMTYCALATLVILGDNLERVDRKSIIDGIKHIQLPGGSFKPSILGGECDMRLVYCAVAVSQLLNDWSGIDKDRCAKFIKDSLSYEGAFAQCPGAEAHGGSTYCALASLTLMNKLEDTLDEKEIDSLIRWCISRLDKGFSGRPNKDQDTCYSFWIGACLMILDKFKYIDQESLLNFILSAQEEVAGGLSKVPAYFSDPLHTYLGLAGLSFIDEELRQSRRVNLLKLDPTLNISARAKIHLNQLHDKWKNGTSRPN